MIHIANFNKMTTTVYKTDNNILQNRQHFVNKENRSILNRLYLHRFEILSLPSKAYIARLNLG